MGNQLRLEKFEVGDLDRLLSWIDSPRTMYLFGGSLFEYPVTSEQLDKYVLAENRLIYKVVEETTLEVIGHAELNLIDFKNRSARICRIIIGDQSSRNKGYGKAIIRSLIHIGFNELKLHRLDLGVYDFNMQAINCYKACGFEIEGLLKENIRVGEEYWSTYNMSLLNTELIRS